ncbi:MAG TPA: NADH-ubiquinone oxidoreductase-F iron-sulfur binding region domain-containing protein, partial [Actinomycetota bacterium]|nr:NADH-ubiquinone oxidoreductase-F iron-sulfur binding region domain-containing protein [Actinomycetota bacterium]
HRILFPHPIADLDEYLARNGGKGLETARKVDPQALIDEVLAAGLRGRGGAGFPTGIKWQTVSDNRSPVLPTTVVVNGAEGEPGTFKDRTIMRRDPYAVIEGALIAARVMGANSVVFGLKRTFVPEVSRMRAAIVEMQRAGWAGDIDLSVFEGPDEYLYGEETGLLETLDGRYPFPRIAPPFRRGVTEVVEHADDVGTGSGLSAHVDMAVPGGETGAPPTLVDNVETLANVPRIVSRGADWFRTEGTEESPGTIVCTVTGSTRRAGVGEVLMGTPMREMIELVGGGPRRGHRIKAVMPGVSSGLVPEHLLDTPLSYEALAEIGSGLGAGGFIVFDDTDDLAAVAAGVSRFLAVESCGQCTPCKRDGLALAGLLARVSRSEATARNLAEVGELLRTVSDEARCYLALQHQAVVESIVTGFGEELKAHADGASSGVEPALVAELVGIEGDEAMVNGRQADKQPDWSYGDEDSGKWPAERFDEHRAPKPLED